MTLLINKLNKIINKEYTNEILNIINIKCKSIRTPKYTNEYYLYYIILVLTDLQKWQSLTLILDKKTSKNHYKTIQDKHLQWSELNIYEDAYRVLLKKYKISNLTDTKNLTLFIDSSLIYNKNGSVQVEYGSNPKKKESKISAICDEHKNIYSIIITKTSANDSKTVRHTLENLKELKLKYKTLHLVGDKGYATNIIDKKKLLKDFKVNLVYPNKKNQKQRTSEFNKKN